MQTFLNQHPALFIAAFTVFFLLVSMVSMGGVALAGSWRLLAETYRTERELPAHRRSMQSAQMRYGTSYNNILTLASDADGLYLALALLFRFAQPKLFIPWSEIQINEPKRYLFLMSRMFYLGPNRVPFRIREPLAQFLLQPRGGSNAPTPGTISSSF